ncbi:hypothetical protein M9H77_36232 [Catharanthus roseus]|uniref:Uncharacterized protein n=1 Tax=Catharanthus roseus TaxID=4058 RepID=A0ACB9ZR82_CATRO|nr:hypothetical protein M9H77_36232 [Catharanthus roseus]
MSMLEGKKPMKNEEIAEVEGQEKEKGKEWQLEVGGRDISFDDRMLNTTLGTPENDEQKMQKMSLKSNLQRSKRSLKTTGFCEDEVVKLKTLKIRSMVRDSIIRYLYKTP